MPAIVAWTCAAPVNAATSNPDQALFEDISQSQPIALMGVWGESDTSLPRAASAAQLDGQRPASKAFLQHAHRLTVRFRPPGRGVLASEHGRLAYRIRPIPGQEYGVYLALAPGHWVNLSSVSSHDEHKTAGGRAITIYGYRYAFAGLTDRDPGSTAQSDCSADRIFESAR